MIPSPTRDENQRWAIPTTALSSGTRIMATPSRLSCARSSLGRASSSRERTRRAGTTERELITTIVARIPASHVLYGWP